VNELTKRDREPARAAANLTYQLRAADSKAVRPLYMDYGEPWKPRKRSAEKLLKVIEKAQLQSARPISDRASRDSTADEDPWDLFDDEESEESFNEADFEELTEEVDAGDASVGPKSGQSITYARDLLLWAIPRSFRKQHLRVQARKALGPNPNHYFAGLDTLARQWFKMVEVERTGRTRPRMKRTVILEYDYLVMMTKMRSPWFNHLEPANVSEYLEYLASFCRPGSPVNILINMPEFGRYRMTDRLTLSPIGQFTFIADKFMFLSFMSPFGWRLLDLGAKEPLPRGARHLQLRAREMIGQIPSDRDMAKQLLLRLATGMRY
jgi:hypothetical protein